MSLNETPSSERIRIGFFGRRNAGKSSVINRLTNQDLSVVSRIPGTTTDPVRKAMEIHGLGPVVIVDTAGIDDEGELGTLRIRKTREELGRIDLAVLVVGDGSLQDCDREMAAEFGRRNVPWILCYNKCDLMRPAHPEENAVVLSAKTGEGFEGLFTRISQRAKEKIRTAGILDGLISEKSSFVLVIPMDEEAPKGRIILPQQMVLHEILVHHAKAAVVQPEELKETLAALPETDLVITDSQAFRTVKDIVPEEIPLTSFSILLARYRGFLTYAVESVKSIDNLQDGDRVLISEGCTHHRTCGDIGSIKIPALLKRYTGKDIEIALTSGMSFAEDLSSYRLAIHCGGCMLGAAELRTRMERAREQGLPFTNYGIAISYMNGILERSLRMLPEFRK